MDKLFKEKSQSIRIYLARETEVDPFEKNVELTEISPIPIKAIVTDLIASQAIWKMTDISTTKAKEIIVEKKYRTLIEQSQRIKIDDDYYEGWRVDGRMQIREEGNYCRIYCYIKKA